MRDRRNTPTADEICCIINNYSSSERIDVVVHSIGVFVGRVYFSNVVDFNANFIITRFHLANNSTRCVCVCVRVLDVSVCIFC